MSITERMAAIHIDPAAANNRGDGSTAGTAWRDCEELTRRLGRGTAVFRQPTIVTYHGNTSSSDAARFDNVLVGKDARLTLQGVATVAASGTLTSFTPFSRTAGAEALNIVGASGLAGGFAAHVGRYMRISSGARAGNGWWIHQSFGATASVTTPGTFVLPHTTGSGLFSRATPQAGDPFEIVTIPSIACGDWSFGSAFNQPFLSGTGLNQVNVQDLELDFGGKIGGGQHDNATTLSVQKETAFYMRRCTVWTGTVFGGGITQFYQCDFRGNVDVVSGLLARFVAGRHSSAGTLAVRGGSNAVVDYDDLFDGASGIFAIDQGTIIVGTACIFNKGSDRTVLIDPGCQIWVSAVGDTPATLWGASNPNHGVTIQPGGRLIVDAGATITVNKTLGANREMFVGGQDILYSQINGSITNNAAMVAFL
jgi:hypothetical protein